MKILLVSGFFPPTHTAGSEKRTLGYALELKKLGHSVQVLCAGSFDEGAQYWNGITDEIYRDIPVRRVYLNWQLAPDPNRYLYDNPVIAEHLDDWITEWQPEVAHIISCYTLSASIIEVLRHRGVPLLLTLVDFWFVCPRLNLLHADGSLCDGRTTPWECQRCMLWNAKIYRWSRRVLPENFVKKGLTFISKHPALSRQHGLIGMALDMEHRKRYLTGVLSQVDFITAPSHVLAEMVRGAGMDIAIQVIHSGHDLTWLTTMPPRHTSSVIRFGYIGQISPQKGVYELVAAFIKGDFDDNVELHVYGNQNQNPEYMQRINRLLTHQSSNVTFHGAFPPDRLGEVLAQIDVLVVPSSWWENNPRVIQEAFASKTPVIASDVTGIAEFVTHEVNGLLFERGSVTDLTQQLRRVAQDPSLLTQLQAGITPVKTIEQEMAELIAVYERLLGKKHHE